MELEVIVGTYDCAIIGYSIDLLSVPEKQTLRKKYYEGDHVGCVRCVSSGGHYLASGGTDETIRLYNMHKHIEIGTLLQHEGSISGLTFYKDTHLLSCSEDGTICIWKCGRKWECLHILIGHKYQVTCVTVHPSGRLALSVGKDRTLRTWNLLTGRPAFTLRLSKAADLVLWNPIGSHYALTVGSTLMVYSVETGEPSSVIEVKKNINSIIFIKDSVLAVGSEQPSIVLYSTKTGKILASLEGHSNRVKGLAMSPDHSLLFSTSSDGTIKVWTLPKLLEGCKCVCSVDTGSRPTCITVLLPNKRAHKEEEKGGVEEIVEDREEEVEENREREEKEGKEEEIEEEREEELDMSREIEDREEMDDHDSAAVEIEDREEMDDHDSAAVEIEDREEMDDHDSAAVEIEDREEMDDHDSAAVEKRRKKDKSTLSVSDCVQEENNAVGGDTERDRKRRTSAVGKRKSKRISTRIVPNYK